MSERGLDQTVRITVDAGMCMGVRSCIQTAPASFVMRQPNLAAGVEDPGDDLATIMEAAAACPNFAVAVEVDGKLRFDPEAP